MDEVRLLDEPRGPHLRAGLMNEPKTELERLMAANVSPAGKRKALLQAGVRADYVPHHGANEIARRAKKNQKAALT